MPIMIRYLIAGTLHLSTLCLIAMFGIGAVNICMRLFLGVSIIWSEEVSRYLIPWLTFLGSALLAGSGLHMTIADWRDVKGWKRTALRTVGDVTTFVTLSYIAYFGVDFAMRMANRSLITLPGISMALIYSALPVGCVLWMLFIIFARLGWFPEEMARMYADPEEEEEIPCSSS